MLFKKENVLEILDAIHAFGIFFREHKAAESGAKFFPAGSMRHAPQTRAVPVDLASLFIECAFLRRFFCGFIQ